PTRYSHFISDHITVSVLLFQFLHILTNRTADVGRFQQLLPRNTALLGGIGFHKAAIHRQGACPAPAPPPHTAARSVQTTARTTSTPGSARFLENVEWCGIS